MDYSIIIPTYNGGLLWTKCIESIQLQSIAPNKVVIVDSNSSDETILHAQNAGFETYLINKENFDHGGTRTEALKYIDTEIVVFLTQDCILESQNSISELLNAFENSIITAVYGRQIPHLDANPLASYALKHNYTNVSYVTSLHDKSKLGFKKVFFSNSFSAYRLDTLKSVGGFPSKLILGEDSYVAAKMLIDGKKIAYQASSCVFHSHNYTISEEFSRYFDIGVFHRSQSWIVDRFGSVESEGIKFAFNQINELFIKRKYFWLLASCLYSLSKFLGYKLGWHYRLLGQPTCKFLSMFKSYWK